jgi:uncharacterized protein (UPF0332 family)
MMSNAQREEIAVYLQQAEQMLAVAQYNFEAGFLSTAVNRSYYAVFYAASALLVTEGESRSKHYGVISAFRQHFVKTERWEMEYSHIFGRLLADRENADYALFESISHSQTSMDVQDAQRFVIQAKQWLTQEGWL